MSLKKDLGKRIQIFRKQRRLTQESMSEVIGIDPKSLSEIERGNSYPSPETLTSIAKALNIELYELFVFNDEIPYSQMKEEIINSLSDNKKVLYLYRALKGL